jgi:hypothetical protein
MTPEQRTNLIDRLDRSFLALPRWAKIACKHGMGAPKHHPETGKEYESFREVLESGTNEWLEVLKGDFESNEDLAPEEVPPEPEFTMPFSNNVIRKDWVMWKARILTHHKEEVVPHTSIVSALYAARDKLDLPTNYPNPDPGKLILNVREEKEWDTFVFFYTEPKEEAETPK